MALTAMPTDSNVSQRRRRPATYGRVARRNTESQAYNFDVSDVPSPADRSRLVKPAGGITYSNSSSTAVSAGVDVFDIPSSGDENGSPTLPLNPAVIQFPNVHQAEMAPTSDIFDVPLSDQEASPAPRSRFSVQTGVFTIPKSSNRTAARRQLLQPSQPCQSTSQPNLPKVSVHNAKRRRVSTSPNSTGRTSRDRSAQKSASFDARQLNPKCNWETAKNSDVRRLSRRTEVADIGVIPIGDRKMPDKDCSSTVNISRKPITSAISEPAALKTLMKEARHPCKSLQIVVAPVSVPHTPERLKTSRDMITTQPLSQNRGGHSSPPPPGNKLASTPRQTKIWSSLLQSVAISTPNSSTTSRSSIKQPDTTSYPRKRLIDTLGTLADESSSPEDGHSRDDFSIVERMAERPSGDSDRTLYVESPSGSQTVSTSRTQAKITYGGQHSYLDDSGSGIEGLLTMSTDFGPASTSIVGEAAERMKHHENLKHNKLSDEDSFNTMRSIHELRASGDSIRFENDLSMEDFEVAGKSSVSRKRSAILLVCERLSDGSFRDRFTQYGLELRILVACQDELDLIVGTALATMLTYVLALPSSLRTAQQLYAAGAIEFLSRLLDEQRDIMTIAKARVSNTSKLAQNSVADFKMRLLSSTLWCEQHTTTLSPMVIALRCLDFLVQRLRKEKVKDSILTMDLLVVLLRILHTALHNSDNGKTAVQKSDVAILRSVLSMLESFTIVESCTMNTHLWNVDTISKLVDEFDNIMDCCTSEVDGLIPLISRICLNLSNNAEENTVSFSKPTFVAKLMSSINTGLKSLQHTHTDTGKNSIDEFDNLVLALGAMFNLAEWSDSARLVTLRNCREDLDAMVVAFTDSRSRASEASSLAASSANVAYGYLAVLLGHLCQNKEVRGYICTSLPGMSLGILSAAVEEFIVHHREADKRQESDETWVAFTHRLVVVAEGLKNMCTET